MALPTGDVDDADFYARRDAGTYICPCATPAGPDNGECGRCRRPIITPGRAAYLADRYQLGTPAVRSPR